MPFNRWLLLLLTTGWHVRARLHPLLLACAFLAFAGTHVVSAADGGPAATPEAAVRLFYPWYLGEMMQGRVPLTEERMLDYVAEDTLRDIAFMMNRPNGGKRGLREDYFLHAKDYFDDWGDHIGGGHRRRYCIGAGRARRPRAGDATSGTHARPQGRWLENLSGERGGSFKIATARPFSQ